MVNHFNAGASTIWKYVDIVCDVLFNKYIDIPSRNWLRLIIQKNYELIGLPNICGSKDGIHIPLANFPNKKVTWEKKIHGIVLQGVCGGNKWFQNVCVGQPRGVQDGA